MQNLECSEEFNVDAQEQNILVPSDRHYFLALSVKKELGIGQLEICINIRFILLEDQRKNYVKKRFSIRTRNNQKGENANSVLLSLSSEGDFRYDEKDYS